MSKTPVFLGVDPGTSGASALIDGHSGKIIDICRHDKSTYHDIGEWYREWCDHEHYYVKARLEKVHAMPGQGVSSTFKFGKSFGFLEGLLVSFLVPYELVTPKTWQTYMKCKTGGDKNISKAAAQRIWPDHKIIHTIADALLLAEYCRRTCLALEPNG